MADHHRLVRAALERHGGREVDTQGDAFFAVFTSPRACVAASLDIQRSLSGHRWPDGATVRVRMGIHTGEVAEASTGLVGFEVHRAARIASVGYGGQVLLSSTTAALVEGSLPAAVELLDLGAHRLKDLSRSQEIYQLVATGLAGDFPPLRSLDNPELPNNLPAQSASFIGRHQEVEDIRTMVEGARLVTLTGAGGSGKTRLSLQVAAELLDGSGDGVWFVELAPLSDPDNLASVITSALRIPSRPDRTPLESLLEALEHQNVLVVLDNCEHLVGECAAIADAILRRCPRVHLMATSREPLGVAGETIYRVPSLSLPPVGDDVDPGGPTDAVLLFLDRARSQGAELVLDSETAPLIDSICRRLDGMPLAIELAAARLRSMSLVTLHQRLDQRFRLLTGGSRNALPRQQTLRATVDWSFSMLSEDERSVLVRMSVFVDGFDLEAAEAVCGIGEVDPFDVADIVGSLVDKSLVVVEQHGGDLRYHLLETIRQFGAERLLESGEQAVVETGRAHAEHFATVAETTAPALTGRNVGWGVTRLDAEWGNIRRALQYGAERPDCTPLVLRLTSVLNRYWWIRPRTPDLVDLIVPVVERGDARVDLVLLGRAYVALSHLVRVSDRRLCMEFGQRTHDLAVESHDERLLVDALGIHAAVKFFSGEYATGLPLARKCVDRARQLGDELILAASLMQLLLFGDVLDDGEGARLLREAIELTEQTGDLVIMLSLHNNAASSALGAGDLVAARTHLEQLEEAGRLLWDENHPIWLFNWGWLLLAEGNLEEARERFVQGVRLARRWGDRSSLGYNCLGLARLATMFGDWTRSAVMLGIADQFMDDVHEPWQEGERRGRDEMIHALQAELGGEELDRLVADGRRRDFDQRVQLALRVDDLV